MLHGDPLLPSPDFGIVFTATPLALVVVAVDDPTFTVVAVNDAYLRVSGVSRDRLVGHPLFDVFPNNPEDPGWNKDVVLDSYRRAIATKLPVRIAPYRYDIQTGTNPDDQFEKHYWSAEATPLLDANGEPRYILQSAEDITSAMQAEEKAAAALRRLQTSEERFRQIAETSGFGLIIADQQGGLSYVNTALLTLLGYTEAEVVAGKVRWDELTPPEMAARDAEAWREVLATGKCAPYEKVYIARDGRRIPILIGASLLDSPGDAAEVAAFVMDLTARKRRDLDSFLIRLDDETRTLSEPGEIIQAVAKLVVEQLQTSRCGYVDVEDDEDTFTVSGNFYAGVGSVAGRYAYHQFGEACLTMLRNGQPFVVNDSETDTRLEGVRNAYRDVEIRSTIRIPLLKKGRFVAAMAVHQTTPRKWQPDEVELVRQVASRCWESIERVRVARELHHREQRYRFLAESIPQMVWTARPDGSLDYVNEQVSRYFGTTPENVMGAGWLDWVHPDDQASAVERWTHSIVTSEPYETTFRLLRENDGSWRWHLIRAQPLMHDGGVVQWFGTCTDIEDQKEAEELLRQQWRTFDTALRYTADYIYTFDLDGRFAYSNQALLDLFQLPREAVLGKTSTTCNIPGTWLTA